MQQDIAHEEALVGLVTSQAAVLEFATILRVQVIVDLAPGVNSSTILPRKRKLESEGKQRARGLLEE